MDVVKTVWTAAARGADLPLTKGALCVAERRRALRRQSRQHRGTRAAAPAAAVGADAVGSRQCVRGLPLALILTL